MNAPLRWYVNNDDWQQQITMATGVIVQRALSEIVHIMAKKIEIYVF